MPAVSIGERPHYGEDHHVVRDSSVVPDEQAPSPGNRSASFYTRDQIASPLRRHQPLLLEAGAGRYPYRREARNGDHYHRDDNNQ